MIKKKGFVREWYDTLENVSKSSQETDQKVEIFFKVFNEAGMSKTPIVSGLLNILSNIKRDRRDTVGQFRKFLPEVNNLFGAGDEVVNRTILIAFFMGGAILFSFLALFMYSNKMDQSVWPFFLATLSFMTGAIGFYYVTWKYMRELSDIIDNTSLSLDRANRVLNLGTGF